MKSQPTRQPLGQYLSMEAVGPLVEKRLLGGYQVRYLPFLWTAGFWVFLKGVVLGHALRDRIEVVARLLTAEGAERKMAQGLGEIARRMVEDYGSLPESFFDFWLKTEAREAYDKDLHTLKRLYNRKERLGLMLPLLSYWCWEGVGFGVTYADHAEKMWRTNFEIVDDEREKKWQRARAAGLDLPEVPDILPLAEMESIVLEQTREYARTYFPELDLQGV